MPNSSGEAKTSTSLTDLTIWVVLSEHIWRYGDAAQARRFEGQTQFGNQGAIYTVVPRETDQAEYEELVEKNRQEQAIQDFALDVLENLPD